jgi:hypothetical protein
MIEALESGDRKGLVKLCSEHLDISKRPYIEAYRERFAAQAQSR